MFKNRSPFKLTSFLIFIILAFFCQTHTIKAQSILYQDNFDNGIDSLDWEINNFVSHEEGSSAPISELEIFSTSGAVQITGIGTIDLYPVDGVNVGWIGKSLMLDKTFPTDGKLIIEAEVNIETATNAGYLAALTIEFDPASRIIIFIGTHAESQNRVAGMIFDENDDLICIDCLMPFDFTFGDYSLLRLEFDYNTNIVQFYINNLLYIEGIYEGSTHSPKVGIASLVRLVDTFIDSRFENFKVSTGSSFKLLDVPHILQYSDPWGRIVYDHSERWYPSNPSIARWGCALTSAVMMLNYFGDGTNPNELNAWLNNHNAYARNGAVVWPSLSRYSSVNPNTPTLEFNYLNYSKDMVINGIDLQHPSILKLTNTQYGGSHFVVSKGYNDLDILINDPGKSSNQTLSEANIFWGDTLKIGNFSPSETDLSYIVLFIDEEFTLKVSSESGIITGNEYYFEEEPMSNRDDPNAYREVAILNTFYFPKPVSGIYKIEVTGEGVYQLDSYLYNKEGEEIISTFKGIVSENHNDEFMINVGITPEIKQVLTASAIVDDLNAAYSNNYIKSRFIFRVIKRLIYRAESLLKIDYLNYSQNILKHVNNLIKICTPQFVDPRISEILQKNIEILIN